MDTDKEHKLCAEVIRASERITFLESNVAGSRAMIEALDKHVRNGLTHRLIETHEIVSNMKAEQKWRDRIGYFILTSVGALWLAIQKGYI